MARPPPEGASVAFYAPGATDLVRLKVDVLFVAGAGLAKILQLETKTIPIVVGRAEGDLVAAGLVDSLARPADNITGSQILNDDLAPKRLELLRALMPRLSKVAFLQEDATPAALPEMRVRHHQAAAIAARTLGIELRTIIVHRAEDLPAAFRGMGKNHDQAVMVSSSAFMFVHRRALADLETKHRIPDIYELQAFLESGGLMSYGLNIAGMQRRAGGYVDKILKAAKALGRTIPPSLLGGADEVIR